MILMKLITRTPMYVWGIFIYLIIIGMRATKTRTIWIPQLFLIPFALTLLRLPKLISMSLLWTFSPWLVGINLGITIALMNKKLVFLLDKNSIQLPGSYHTLVMFLTLFMMRYSLGFLQQSNHDAYASYANLDTMVTFLFAGYSFGKATTYTYRFLRLKWQKKEIV
jgi:hypothetical protein